MTKCNNEERAREAVIAREAEARARLHARSNQERATTFRLISPRSLVRPISPVPTSLAVVRARIGSGPRSSGSSQVSDAGTRAAMATRALTRAGVRAASSGEATDPFDFQSNLRHFEDLDRKNLSEDLQLIGLQQKIQRHTQYVSTVSNILKVENETAKNIIGNLR